MLFILWSLVAYTSAFAACARPTSTASPPAGAVSVSPNGTISGTYATFTDALKVLKLKLSAPDPVECPTVFVYTGCYEEQILIDVPNVRVIGQTKGSVKPGLSYTDNRVTLYFHAGFNVRDPKKPEHGNTYVGTVIVSAENTTIYNINFVNTNNIDGSKPDVISGAATLMAKSGGIAVYACSFDGWQDTFYTLGGTQYIEGSYLGGAIDWVYGRSTTYFMRCVFAGKRKGGFVTAHKRKLESDPGMYVIDASRFDAAPGYLGVMFTLGRPWSEFARVIIKHSYLSSNVDPAGWSLWSPTDTRLGHVLFGEYQNQGPGSYENNLAARKSFGHAELLNADEYTIDKVFNNTDWIDFETIKYNTPPSYASGPTSALCDAVPGPKALEVGVSTVNYQKTACSPGLSDTLRHA